MFNLTVSKALAGFELAELAVDSSPEGTLNSEYFQYRLLNLHELTEVKSMKIAPGFTNSENEKKGNKLWNN
ncbi:hypothetical protein [Pseudoalteromonas maricaloris]|uniref:hypothetical protein n=1 Tax=Pseudoalteromonas maricaloris TaxID=184924 RepID=UPI003C1E9D6C